MGASAMDPDLASYDIILISTSAGKDSQVAMDKVTGLAREAGVSDRLRAVHADLGRVEWKGTPELARTHAEHYGMPIEYISRERGDLLDHVRQRGKWPASNARYCTSDHKRDQIRKVMTRLVREIREKTGVKQARVLDVQGIRAEESTARAKKVPFFHNRSASNGRRHVDTWYPVFDWTKERVWDRIRETRVPYHPAYDYGMPRLSCCFCIYAPKAALVTAGRHNPDLLDEYVRTEEEIGHKFRLNLAISEVRDAVREGSDQGPVEDWSM